MEGTWLPRGLFRGDGSRPIQTTQEVKTNFSTSFKLTQGEHSPHLLRTVLPYVCVCILSHSLVSDSETPWTVACQAPLSMGFSRQEYGVGCRALLQGICPTQGSNPGLLCLLHWQVGSLPLSHLGSNFPILKRVLT